MSDLFTQPKRSGGLSYSFKDHLGAPTVFKVKLMKNTDKHFIIQLIQMPENCDNIYKLVLSSMIYLYLVNQNSKNPYRPCIPFVGHIQTVQTQIRRRKMRRLISVSTVCLQSQSVLLKCGLKLQNFTKQTF